MRSLLETIGFRLVRASRPSEYGGGVIPVADYTPWNVDQRFVETYRAVRNHTLVDIYRCWELWTLAGQAAKLAPEAAILEVGVWRGGTGALLARRAGLSGQGRPVYLCDTFSGVVKAGSEDNRYRGGEHSDTSKELVEQLLKTLHIENTRVIQGVFPDESEALLGESRFCLVHVDVDTYQSAKDIVNWVWGRLIPGGVVIYDDYGFNFCAGITRLVNEHAADTDKLVLHNLNGHGIVMKTCAGSSLT